MDAQESELARLEGEAREAIAAARSLPELAQVRARYLGRQGSVSGLLRGIGGLPPDARARAGAAANEAKERIEEWVEGRRAELEGERRARALATERLDVTLPGTGHGPGRLHPVVRVAREVERFFAGLGFSLEEGPEVETEWNNFDALNMPPDHPARDMQATFWVEGGHLLRTHTSPVQIRAMSGRTPPFRFIAMGRVYRHDLGPRNYPMFQQVEGFAVDAEVSFAHLKDVLYAFARFMFGEDTELRFRASYFPFTEPSAELDFRCPFCRGGGCATCSRGGWIEWGGCGMIHPQVLRHCGIDPERQQGFAFGMGLERAAMDRHALPQIRLLYEGDLRVLEQL
jgi:phenylalanyl-tRNA synthetase alpha chain